MAKCKNCRSCLSLVDTGEAVYNHCSLCGKYYELRTGKEINFMDSIFVVKALGKDYIISTVLFKDESDLRSYMLESIGLLPEDIEGISVRSVGISRVNFGGKLLADKAQFNSELANSYKRKD